MLACIGQRLHLAVQQDFLAGLCNKDARMIQGGIGAFAGARVLLLQGPVGPFFARFARDLKRAGAHVETIAFNGGDWLFRPGRTICPTTVYRGTMADWPCWLAGHMAARSIEVVFLFGDCRPIHQAAHRVATRMGIDVGVFEEGYLRPDFITLERHGVNANSMMRRLPAPLGKAPMREIRVHSMPRSFWPMVLWACLYFAATNLARPWFPHYRHHRPIGWGEALAWARSPLRKAWYAVAERGLATRMTGEWSGRFFLAPLQVYLDAQVRYHANVGGVDGFIASTIDSFGENAPADAVLVFKHHPMDRGHRNYTRAIGAAARSAGCEARVVYCHDQHMPTILPHCRGMVVINSTTGLAAIGFDRPTIVRGEAIYDRPGLTYQGSLDRFWREAADHPPDPEIYRRFRAELIAATQINGNFYRRLDAGASATGLIWPMPTPDEPDNVVPFPIKGSSSAAPAARTKARARP